MRDILGIGINYQYNELTWESKLFTSILGHINQNVIDIIKEEAVSTILIHFQDIFMHFEGLIDPRSEYMFVPIDESAIDEDQQQKLNQPVIKTLFKLQEHFQQQIEKKKYMIIDCEKDKSWDNHYGSLYQSLLREPHELWTVFKLMEEPFPKEEELNQLNGIVISGSFMDVNEQNEQIVDLVNLIQNIYYNYSHINILGICFGHQIVSYSLGATVEVISNLEFKSGYVRHMNQQTLKFNKQNLDELNMETVKQIKGKEIRITKSHGQQVTELAAVQLNIARSETTVNEIILHDKRWISFQGHPEVNSSYFIYKWLSQIQNSEAQNFLQKTKQIIQDYQSHYINQELFVQIIFQYFKNQKHQNNFIKYRSTPKIENKQLNKINRLFSSFGASKKKK